MEPYEEDEYEGMDPSGKSLKGYKIVIILLAVILAALSGLYFQQVHQIKKDFAVERDTLTNRLAQIRDNFDNLKTTNDTISYNLNIERNRADSLMERLQNERNWSRAKIRQYEKELGTLRSVMKNYIHQIDSLNTLNKKLIHENVNYRKEASSLRLRADMAEEKAQELDVKVRRGSVVHARDIRLVMLNAADKEVTRASRAERLRVDLVLSANELTNPGERAVYVRITAPDGYVMSNTASATFMYEGDPLIYSAVRDNVDYQNKDLAVGIYYNGGGITSGQYLVEVYMDGFLIGSLKTLLR